MRSRCKQKLIDQLRQIKNKPQHEHCSQCVLVLDQVTTKIISTIVSLQTLLDLGIKYLTKTNLKKKPQPHSIGIYFICEASISSIVKDFQKEQIYFSINILMNQPIKQQTMVQLVKNQKVMQRLATFAQLIFPCQYYSQNIAILGNQNLIKPVFQNIRHVGQQIAETVFQSMIASFNLIKTLKIHYSDQLSFSIAVAKTVQRLANDYLNSIQQGQKNEKNQQGQQINLIVFDRNIDLVSPVVRNFYYFPMMVDIFQISQFKQINFQFQLGQKAKHTFSYEDKVFNKYKNKHVSEAFNTINKDLTGYLQQNKIAKFQKEKQVGQKSSDNTTNLKDVLKQLPQYTKTVKNYNQHIQIMNQLSLKSKRLKFTDLGQLQHLIITSINSKAEVEKDKKIYQKMMQVMPTIKNQSDRARLLYLSIQCLDLAVQQKSELISQLSKIQSFQGFQFIFANKIYSGKLRFNPIVKKQSIFLDRHQCTIAKRFYEIASQKQNKSKQYKNINIDFKRKFQKNNKLKKNTQRQVKNWVILMIGGLSVNQISNIQRAAQILQNVQVSFFTDHITNPDAFLKDLKSVYSQKNVK